MSEPPLSSCPQCGRELRRLINGGSGVIFKGSGFYVTDKKGGSGASGAGKPAAKTGGGASSADGAGGSAAPSGGDRSKPSAPASGAPSGNGAPAGSAGSAAPAAEKKAAG